MATVAPLPTPESRLLFRSQNRVLAAFATRNLKTVLAGIFDRIPSCSVSIRRRKCVSYALAVAAIEHKHETPNAYD